MLTYIWYGFWPPKGSDLKRTSIFSWSDTDTDTDTDTDAEEGEEMRNTVWSAALSLDLDAQVAVVSRPVYSNDRWLANYNNSISAADLPIFRIN
jgi:hypothetical protein